MRMRSSATGRLSAAARGAEDSGDANLLSARSPDLVHDVANPASTTPTTSTTLAGLGISLLIVGAGVLLVARPRSSGRRI